MPVIRSSGSLITYVEGLLADNNAGEISAADVRNSVLDTIVSINSIVSSGDFNSATPFYKNVRIKRTAGNENTGHLIVESGIIFSNYPSETQFMPYPGPQSINHNQLSNLTTGDVHTQYAKVNGSRPFENGNIGFSNCWINASGSSNVETTNGKGLQFSYVSSTRENINVGSGTQFVFLKDKSILNSARGVAKAWINFDASGVTNLPVVRDSYNVSGIQRLENGKFKIIFHSGVFSDNNYVAIGSSNSTTASGSKEDFTNNTVGIVMREGNDATSLRSLTFVIRDEGGEYVNAKINDLVVYGTEPTGSGSPPVTIIT